ncbi:uncharacterized protein LOC129005607 [Macrosteles quadrilineatus]|uniref:uncharacterized protein LOC129005607 n=1 Tax=Macrosteles quadrilineatus TaxID=74068 RepID=UPI0023E19C1C|nr:uncharacterized protein LOC129005607 [Macrosteles quadrilineatus]
MSRFAVLLKFDNEDEAMAALRDLRARHTVKESRSYEIIEVVSNYTPAGLMAAVMRCEKTQRYEVQLGRKRKPTAVVSGIPAVRRRFTPPPAPLPLAATTSSPLPLAATAPSPLPLGSVPPLSPLLLFPPAPLSPQQSTSWHTPPPPPPLPLTPQPSRHTPPTSLPQPLLPQPSRQTSPPPPEDVVEEPLTPQPSRQTPPPPQPSPEIINISSDEDSLDGLLAEASASSSSGYVSLEDDFLLELFN